MEILRWFISHPYDAEADREEIKRLLGPNIQPRNSANVGFNGEDFVCIGHTDPLVMEQTERRTRDGRFVYKCPVPGCGTYVIYSTQPHPQASQSSAH